MEITESTIDISANPQTVWSVLDDLPAYPEWNPVIPQLEGRTTLGEIVSGELVIPNMPTPPLTPTITRVVAGRELRWRSIVPGDQGFSAEHIFILEPIETGTRLVHREVFDGPAAPHLAEPIRSLVHPAYENFDRALKARAEQAAAQSIQLHPSVGSSAVRSVSEATVLRCACPDDVVELTLTAPVAHDHLCGCSKCWKPDGALFARTAVVASDGATVTANEEKLELVEQGMSISRRACRECGVHMIGEVSDPEHHFYGLTFVHPERSDAPSVTAPEFAGFVSSLVENGASASAMEAVHTALGDAGIPAFDAFSPEIMNIIAYHKRKIANTTSHKGAKA